ncbi:MAG: hypothetical protein ACYTEO_17060, partial [Planctomycetota bacterium]
VVFGDHYNTDIDGNITGQVRPGEWNFEKYFCSEWTPPLCASFFRTSCYKAIDLRDYTACDEFDFWINLGARFPIRYVSGIVAKYAVHPGQFGCQSDLLDRQVASRKLAIGKICNNPQTPEWIRSLRNKAIAGLYPSRAIANCNIGAWDVAKKNASEAFRVGPNPEKLHELAELLYRHSTELYRKGQLEEALEYLDLLIEGNVSGEGFNYQRANILFKLGRISEAAKASYEELKCQPDHRSAKAIIRLAQSCPEGTVQSHNDKLAEELLKTGVKYLGQGDAIEAMRHFQEAVVDCAALPSLYFALATAYAQVGILYKARQACEIELKFQPEHDGAKRLLARLNQAINEYEHVNMPG